MAYSAKELGLDYYQFYDVPDVPLQKAIKTCGQFDNNRDINCVVQKLDYFANPVMKFSEPMVDKMSHLNFYRVSAAAPLIYRSVKITNQFGTQKIIIGKLTGILVPAQKIEQGSTFPRRTSHFAVYEVKRCSQVNKQVRLKDQFGQTSTTVLAPSAFAVPIRKKVGLRVYPVINPKAHLVIYQIIVKPFKKDIKTKDQFKLQSFSVYARTYLAAPTLKRGWTVIK